MRTGVRVPHGWDPHGREGWDPYLEDESNDSLGVIGSQRTAASSWVANFLGALPSLGLSFPIRKGRSRRRWGGGQTTR